MNQILHILIGDLSRVADAAIKTSALFLTAAILFLSPNDARIARPFLMRLHSASCRCWAAGRRVGHRSSQTRKAVRLNHPGESAARTMTTHPGSSQG